MPLTPRTFDDSNWNRSRTIVKPNFGSPGSQNVVYFARVVAREEIVLSGLQTIDEIVLAAEDKVLVTDNGSNNAVYTVVDGGAWTKVSGTDKEDILVVVKEGTLNARTLWLADSGTPTFNTIRGGG